MTPTKWGVLALMWLAFSGCLFAETPKNNFIQDTVEHHPSMMAAQAQKEALLKAVDQTQVVQNPELELGVGQKNDGLSTGLTFETTLKQTVFYPGKLAAKKALALSEVELQEVEIQRLKSELTRLIVTKAFQLNLTVKRTEMNQKRIHKLHWVKDYLNSRPFVSPQKKVEIRLVESDLKDHQLEDIQLRSQAETSLLELQALMAKPVLGSIEVEIPSVDLKTLESLHGDLLTKNPELKVFALKLNQVEQDSQNLALDAKPNFDLFGRYASESASGKDQFLSVGIGLELPLSNKNQFALQAQPHKKQALELQRDKKLKDLEAEWQSALVSIKKAQAIVELYNPDWISQLENSLDQAIDAFKKGQVDLLSVLELESQWVNASNKRFDAKLDQAEAYANLIQLLGQTSLSGEIL